MRSWSLLLVVALAFSGCRVGAVLFGDGADLPCIDDTQCGPTMACINAACAPIGEGEGEVVLVEIGQDWLVDRPVLRPVVQYDHVARTLSDGLMGNTHKKYLMVGERGGIVVGNDNSPGFFINALVELKRANI